MSDGPGKSRRWLLAVALVAGIGGVAALSLSTSDWWPSPTREAERAIDAGEFARAEILLSRLIQDDPREPRARLLHARLLRLSGRSREADAALGKAMDVGVPEASLYREYGLLLAGPDFRKAEPILRKSLKADPGDSEVLRALADGLSRQGMWPEAADVYASWLRVEPDRAEALMGRSRALIQSGRAGQAEAEVRAILGRKPDDYEARMILANGLLSNAELARAEPELERCRQLRPDRPEPLVGLAGSALDRDDSDRARDLLDRAVALDPSSILALAARADLALKLRRDDRALADYGRVVALDPGNRQAHLHLAQILRRTGDPEASAEHERTYRRLQADQEEKFRVLRGVR